LISLPADDTKITNGSFLAFGQSPVLNVKAKPGKCADIGCWDRFSEQNFKKSILFSVTLKKLFT
jgi:hypothetical protein